MRQVVGLPLRFVAVFGHFEWRRHDACVVDQAVQRGPKCEEVLRRRSDTGKIHEVHLQEVNLSRRIQLLDFSDRIGAFLQVSSTHVHMGAMFG
jgi:hypothetical protein